MTQQRETRSQERPFWRALRGFLKFLLRFTIVVLVGVLVGAGLYLGVPWLYHTLVQPVQDNTAQLAVLEHQLEQSQDNAREDLQDFEDRITELEMALMTLRESSAEQAAALTEAEARLATVEPQLDEFQVLERALAEQEAALATLQAELESAVGKLAAAHKESAVESKLLVSRLALVQTGQDLLRVRLLLAEENPRAARETLALAADHLTRAAAVYPPLTPEVLALRERMTTLDGLIVANSFRVAPELEALWADVMDMVLPPADELPTLAPTRTPWLTPTPTPWLTPAPPGEVPVSPLETPPSPTPFLTPTPTPAP